MIDSPDKLKAARKRLGLTQSQLAEELGLSWHAVQSMELGRRPIRRPIQKLIDSVLSEYNRRPCKTCYGSGTVDIEGIGPVADCPECGNPQGQTS